MGTTDNKSHAEPSLYDTQASRFESGIVAFEPCLIALHKAYRDGSVRDWPAVLLSTLLQTTAVSIHKLMPGPEPSHDALDLRSIATLLRNLVDTHDSLHALCRAELGTEDWNLARDIMGYYLSHQLQTIQRRAGKEPDGAFAVAKARYWKTIDSQVNDARTKAHIRTGRTIFKSSRKERLTNLCGKDAHFVEGVLQEWSSFVHSIPASIWLTPSLDAAFSDTPNNRDRLAVWLRIACFYLASSVRVVLQVFRSYEPEPALVKFLDLHAQVFDQDEAIPT